MKKNKLFSGIATALITPFSGGEINYTEVAQMIEFQIDHGIDALVIGGTTAEAATLSLSEREKLYSFSAEHVDGRVPVIFGTGSNDTAGATALTKMAKRCGADGALVVTPYYNKGTDDGIEKHYLSIAENCDLPIILYNVTGRTGVNISEFVIESLAKHEKIVGIKEANDSAERLAFLASFGDELPLYSGNDSTTALTLSAGGCGTISVTSNIFPCLMRQIYLKHKSADRLGAISLQKRLLPFIRALFITTNPAPIKYAMSLGGFCEPELRLPMTAPRPWECEIIKREYEKLLHEC